MTVAAGVTRGPRRLGVEPALLRQGDGLLQGERLLGTPAERERGGAGEADEHGAERHGGASLVAKADNGILAPGAIGGDEPERDAPPDGPAESPDHADRQ